ncbi:hypothetical protein NMY22_g6643 [Coprinellus aureogranulatus]|nr:hypothetical protein NMY22_g6643 [Coprinellus aureogranulatus]
MKPDHGLHYVCQEGIALKLELVQRLRTKAIPFGQSLVCRTSSALFSSLLTFRVASHDQNSDDRSAPWGLDESPYQPTLSSGFPVAQDDSSGTGLDIRPPSPPNSRDQNPDFSAGPTYHQARSGSPSKHTKKFDPTGKKRICQYHASILQLDIAEMFCPERSTVSKILEPRLTG